MANHRGERNSEAKLTNDQVRDIKVLLKAGESVRRVACFYGVSRSTIGHIRTGRLWSSVPCLDEITEETNAPG